MPGSLDRRAGSSRRSSQPHPAPGQRPSSTCKAQCCPVPRAPGLQQPPRRPREAGPGRAPHPGSRHSAPAGYSRRGARSAACPARATARQYEAAPRARRGRETAPRQPPPLATRALKSGPGAAVRAARHPLTSGLPLPPLPR